MPLDGIARKDPAACWRVIATQVLGVSWHCRSLGVSGICASQDFSGDLANVGQEDKAGLSSDNVCLFALVRSRAHHCW